MTDIYAGLGFLVFACMFALALARTAAGSDESSEQLLAEYLREQARAFAALSGANIEAKRLRSGEVATRLSHRRTWRAPSSA
ncbi:MAG: hypothetical protein ACRDK4_15760 [Solirubrobacteraceae bacterium]